jgi:hypothetical protein
MYRDCGNNKNFGKAIFGNKKSLAANKIHKKILKIFISDPVIWTSKLRLPDLFFKDHPYDPELDHELHEYLEVCETEEPIDDSAKRDIGEFLLDIKKHRVDW